LKKRKRSAKISAPLAPTNRSGGGIHPFYIYDEQQTNKQHDDWYYDTDAPTKNPPPPPAATTAAAPVTTKAPSPSGNNPRPIARGSDGDAIVESMHNKYRSKLAKGQIANKDGTMLPSGKNVYAFVSTN